VRALRAIVLGLGLALTLVLAGWAQAEPWLERAPDTIRVATLNAGLVRKGAGMLVREMAGGSAQIDSQINMVAEIILRVRPDILLLTKFDRDPAHRALTGFAERLRAGVAGLEGLDYYQLSLIGTYPLEPRRPGLDPGPPWSRAVQGGPGSSPGRRIFGSVGRDQ
jgi:hypothetical protein